MPFPLVTRRLTIRPLTAADGADVFAVFSAPAVMRYWNSAPPRDRAQAQEWAARLADMQRRLGYAQWRVAERAGDRLVGVAGLQPLDGGTDVEITYALEPTAWGRGYATEAGVATLGYAFSEAGLERVVGIAKPENEASARVLEKLGMRPLGLAEHWGERWVKYALNAGDWRAEQEAATPPLVTRRLELRRLVDADRPALIEVFGDAEVMRFVGPGRRSLGPEDVEKVIAGGRRSWTEEGLGPLAVVERSSGRVIGEAGLQLLEAGPDVELTYTFARAAWGRGYATEAAGAVLLWAFAGLRLTHVSAVSDPANDASLRVLEKLGMTALGPRECYGALLDEHGMTLRRWRAHNGPAGPRL